MLTLNDLSTFSRLRYEEVSFKFDCSSQKHSKCLTYQKGVRSSNQPKLLNYTATHTYSHIFLISYSTFQSFEAHWKVDDALKRRDINTTKKLIQCRITDVQLISFFDAKKEHSNATYILSEGNQYMNHQNKQGLSYEPAQRGVHSWRPLPCILDIQFQQCHQE